MIGKVDVVVLAGGGALKADSGAGDTGADEGNKALLPIGGRLMIDYVIDALRSCPDIGRIVMVGDASFRSSVVGRRSSGLHAGSNVGPEQRMDAASKNLENEQKAGELLFALAGDSPLGSLASGVSVLPPAPGTADWILACTGDIPFLTAGAVSDFLEQCRRQEADFYYPIIERKVAESRFPGVKRTYARLRDGEFTGGNLLMVRRSILGDALPKAEDFIRLRKKPVAMAQLVGFDFMLAYLLGSMTIAMAEERVSRLVGYRGAAVISDYPEIGVDVDKSSDMDLARRMLVPDPLTQVEENCRQ